MALYKYFSLILGHNYIDSYGSKQRLLVDFGQMIILVRCCINFTNKLSITLTLLAMMSLHNFYKYHY
jgi:hypothetical protein